MKAQKDGLPCSFFISFLDSTNVKLAYWSSRLDLMHRIACMKKKDDKRALREGVEHIMV